MKFISYGFLTLMSLGILGAIIGIGGFAWVINHYGQDLPDYESLKTYEPDVVTRVYTGNGRLMAEFSTEKRIFVPIEVIPDLVKQAFISAEDKNFYKHKGLDYVGIARAMINNLKNPNNLQGASTITQQVAKNFLLTNERSYERKIKEAILAIRMERALEKDRLLELYLNEIYLGIGTYGVASASQNYFNKSLDDLTIEEAAYLAALPKAPNNYHPTRKKQRATDRRNWVIGRLLKDGFISDDDAEKAKAVELVTVDLSTLEGNVRAPYFAEEIRRKLQKEFGNDGLYKQGMIVKSSIDPELQKIAEEALRNGLVAYDIRHGYRGPVKMMDNFNDWKTKLAAVKIQQGMLPDWKLALYFGDREIRFAEGDKGKLSQGGVSWAGANLKKGAVIMVTKDDADETLFRIRQVPKVQGAISIMDPHTGRVLAIQGGWDYERSEFNRATQAQRQPGSSFKPFIYLTALESGMTPATIVMDAPVAFEQGPGLPLWRPQNYSDKFYGPTTLRVGIEKSRNVMTVRLADKIGMDAIAETAKKFGIYDNMQKNLASSLGSNETTLMRMVSAYGMLVNGGKKIEPSFIDRIQNRYGKTVYKNDNRQCLTCGPKIRWMDNMTVPHVNDTREKVTEPQRAYQMVSILEGGVQRGTGVRLRNIGFPVAGKTGTTNNSKDAWFLGVTPDLVFGAYVGFDQPKSLGKKETGSSVALPIIKEFLEKASSKNLIEPLPFRAPSGVSMIQVNAKTGRRAYPGDENVIWEAFMSGESPDNQQTVYGGETVVFDEPDMNYMDLFNQIPTNDNGDFQYPEGHVQPQPQNENPTLQGTGGIY
jgi:penicillin-binding protein 1A